jgi:hypothetical protein
MVQVWCGSLNFGAEAAETLPEEISALASSFMAAICRSSKTIHENQTPLNNNQRRLPSSIRIPHGLRRRLPWSNAAYHRDKSG